QPARPRPRRRRRAGASRACRRAPGGQPHRRARPGEPRPGRGGAAAIESLAENFSDGVVAPALWYLALGLPGLFGYKMVNTLDSMIGHKYERYRDFSW